MQHPARLYVDANVLIRAFEGSDALAQELQQLFVTERRQGAFLATSELTLSEVLVGAYRLQAVLLAATYEEWIAPGSRLAVGAVSRDVLRGAATLRAAYAKLKLPDAIHLAAALALGASHFLTFDQRLAGVYQFPEEPVAVSNAAVEVICPNLDVVRFLIEVARQ